MKRSTTALFAAIGTLAFCGVGVTGAMLTTSAVQRTAATTEWVQGTIESVDLENNEFTLRIAEQLTDEEKEEVTLRIDESTQYFLDDQPSTKELALQKGHRASVMHEEKLAMSVDAYSETIPE